MRWRLPRFRRRALDVAGRELLLPSDDEDGENEQDTEHADRAEPAAENAEPCHSFPVLSFYGYQPLNGIPVRLMRPSDSTSRFTCHAFSADGTQFVTGENNGRVRLWRTKNYSPVGEIKELFDSPVKHVSFVKENENIVAAVDNHGEMCNIHFATMQPQEGTSSAATMPDEPRIRFLNKGLSRDSGERQIAASHLSNNGSAFAFCIQGNCKWIHVFKHDENGIKRRLILSFSPFELCFPILSSNGENLACCVRHDILPKSDTHNQTDMQCCVLLWLNLENVKDGMPGIELEGDKAVWGLDGEYLLVWKSFEQNPRLLVYRTNEFSLAGQATEPFRINLSPNLFESNAQMVEPCNPGETLRVFVYEVDMAGLRKVKVWNLEESEADKEVHLANPAIILTSLGEQSSSTAQAERDGPEDARRNRSEWNRYRERFGGTTTAKFSATRDGKWITTYSSSRKCWELVALYSGVSAWCSKLPINTASKQCWKQCEAVFDPSHEQFLLIGEHEIWACAPSFLRPACTQCIAEKRSTSSMLFDGNQEEKILVSRLLQSVGRPALAKILANQLVDERRRIFAFLNIPRHHRAFASVKDVAICSEGDTLAFIGRMADNVSRVFVAKRPKERNSSRPLFSTLPIPSGSEANISERVFLRETDRHTSLILIHRESKLLATFYELQTYEPVTVDLEMDKCFYASQSSDGEQLVILGPKSVCILHLDSQVTKTVKYISDIARMFEFARKASWPLDESMQWNQIIENRLSPDGHTALLGWDSKNKRGVFLTSTMSPGECEKSIAAAEGWMSQYCALSGNGKLTLFVQFADACMFEIHVGIFCNSAGKVLHSVLAVGVSPRVKLPRHSLPEEKAHLLLSNVFFGLSDDGRELVVGTIECNDGDVCAFPDSIRRFSVYGTEECIPDYERLTRVESDAQAIRVKRMFDVFGGSTVNAPSADRCCLLHRAIKERNVTLIDQILLHAKEKNTQVTLECTSETRSFNPFDVALDNNDTNEIKTSLMLLYSPQSPFDRAARMFKDSFARLVKQHLDIVEDALSKDRLIRKACTFEVHLHFMDWKKREESADHIDTMDSFAEWSCDCNNQENICGKWNEKHEKVLERMKKDGEKSTTKAALSFICIENAAKLGMKGILRPLLLAGVPVSFYKCETVKSVVMFKWYNIWKSRTLKNLRIYCVFLVVLMFYTVDIVSIENKSSTGKVRLEFDVFPLLGLFGFGVYFLFEEYRQLCTFIQDGEGGEEGSKWTGAKYFFNSKWNWVDLLSCTLLIVCLPFCHFGSWWEKSFDVPLAICLALESILAYLKVWYFAQSFRHTGSLVSLVYCVIQDCVWFLLLAAVVLVGFGSALYSLYGRLPIKEDDADDVREAFGSLPRTFLTLFFALFGAFDDKLCRSTEKHSWTVAVTFSCYLISETIVLFNLFIAILSDTFDKVKDSQEAHLMMRRARYIDACEAGLCSTEIEKLEEVIGTYVCVLLKPDEISESDKPTPWLGKINALENIFKIGIEKSQNVLKTLIEDALKKIEDVKCVVQHQVETGMLNGIQQLMKPLQTVPGEIRKWMEDLSKRIPEMAQQTLQEIRKTTDESSKQLVKELEEKTDERMKKTMEHVEAKMNEQNSRLSERVDGLESRLEAINEDMGSRLDRLLALVENLQPQA